MAEPVRDVTMKYLIAIAVVIIALTACARPAATPEATVTVTEAAPVPAPVPAPERATDDDDLYLSLLASEGIRASRETSIEVGRSICGALDDGYDKAVLALLAVDSGFTEREAAALVAAAVLVYCPWHES
jgi:hypothetical protein